MSSHSSHIPAIPAERLRELALLRGLYDTACYEQLIDEATSLRELWSEYAPYYLEFEALGHKKRGQYDAAAACLRMALETLPSLGASLFINLSQVLRDGERFDEAFTILEQGQRLFPDDLDLFNEQCHLLLSSGSTHEALRLSRNLAEQHDKSLFWYHRSMAAFEEGLYSEAMQALQTCWHLTPALHSAWHNGLFMAHYIPHFAKEALRALHDQWYEAVCAPLSPTPPVLLERERDPKRTLRIGIFSAGLQKHPAGWMSSRPLQFLSRLPDYELFFYNTGDTWPIKDEVRALFQTMAACWHDAGHWSDARLYEQALNDRLDLAIDMSGHSDGTMLPLFAIRLAPIQIKWVGGLFNTSGVPAMDYLLSDRFETPDGVDGDYVEKLVRLPHSYIAYVPPDYGDEALDAPEAPRDRSNGIVFACFNNAYKINPVIVEVWADILHRVPGSTLLLKGKKFAWPDKQRVIGNWFATHGIGPERLRFEGGAPHRDLMRTYREVDIALDPWPYTGGLTTLEALWMGVPVITTPGPTFAGRHAASHLCNAGLAEFVQPTFAAYADMAVELANQPDLLDHLRQLLRLKVATSPLVNHRQLAADLDTAFRAMWQRYCEGLPPIAMRFEAESPIPDEFL